MLLFKLLHVKMTTIKRTEESSQATYIETGNNIRFCKSSKIDKPLNGCVTCNEFSVRIGSMQKEIKKKNGMRTAFSFYILMHTKPHTHYKFSRMPFRWL